jgi:hypothetical protein
MRKPALTPRWNWFAGGWSCINHFLKSLCQIACPKIVALLVGLACLQSEIVYAFNVGDTVQANGLVWVRQTAGGTYIGDQPSGTQGTVIGGPTVAKIGGAGTSYNWYNINWPSSPDGWVADVGLVSAGLAAPTLTSIIQLCDGTTPGIKIYWSTVAGATNYEVYRNGVLIFTTAGAGTEFWQGRRTDIRLKLFLSSQSQEGKQHKKAGFPTVYLLPHQVAPPWGRPP